MEALCFAIFSFLYTIRQTVNVIFCVDGSDRTFLIRAINGLCLRQ